MLKRQTPELAHVFKQSWGEADAGALLTCDEADAGALLTC